MNKKMILFLDQLNQQFYQKHALSFDQTRQSAWQGWQLLLPIIKKLQLTNDKISVLDVGCGNARFAEFLATQNIAFEYSGIDNNNVLLKQAQERLKALGINFQLKQQNLIKALINKQPLNQESQSFDLVVAFGMLHHIPSLDLRINTIKELGNLLTNQDSKLVITAWQFAPQSRFLNKTIQVDSLNIKPEELEKNDYLLNWQNDNSTPRYCHAVDELEIRKYQTSLKDLSLLEKFLADGKSHNLNQYLIWGK